MFFSIFAKFKAISTLDHPKYLRNQTGHSFTGETTQSRMFGLEFLQPLLTLAHTCQFLWISLGFGNFGSTTLHSCTPTLFFPVSFFQSRLSFIYIYLLLQGLKKTLENRQPSSLFKPVDTLTHKPQSKPL